MVTEDSLRETYGEDVRIVKEHTCTCGTLKGCVPIVEFAAGDTSGERARLEHEKGTPRQRSHVAVCA